MSTVRFRAGEVDLELRGSESFIVRQLKLLSPFLGTVDAEVLDSAPPQEVREPAPEIEAAAVPAPDNGGPVAAPSTDDVRAFYDSFAPVGRDRQADAALLFAYWLQRKEGMTALRLGDLIRCCARAGVDTRNFNRSLGALTRRGFLETVRPGYSYRLSDQGAAAVESRM